MKFTPDNSTTKEQSTSNASTVPTVACKNYELTEYLKSEKFERDFEEAQKDKATR